MRAAQQVVVVVILGVQVGDLPGGEAISGWGYSPMWHRVDGGVCDARHGRRGRDVRSSSILDQTEEYRYKAHTSE